MEMSNDATSTTIQPHTISRDPMPTNILALLFSTLILCPLTTQHVHASAQSALDAVLTSGVRPLDTTNKTVHAHGGCILVVNNTYWWYGTTIKHQPGWISSGIALYSSPDLVSWTNHGVVFDGRHITGMPYPAPYRIERPKVVWNEQYGYFAMLFHLDTPDFGYPAVGVATSPTLTGKNAVNFQSCYKCE